ncbi:hypothetical protein like AT2G24530 [Hibiscus trionum]|uniref:Transcriptional coactivator Hfi1/Transcriptional adapter 1 n=1 Tax=Hibiscus trionum TaxID=183268 RepID=A0A9W7JEX5_HIBTR|nr:hypothetical protein like AT2G24530 [Hibiscus trionum]
MQSRNQHSRVDLIELKARLMKRLGPERSKRYFHYLNKLLSLKLSKVEFNKVCFRILGRENVRLHNLLIRSILKNACNAKAPPPLVTSHCRPRNGDVLLSPRNARSRVLARINAKVDSASHEPIITDEIVVSEDGDLTSHDTWRPVQRHQEVLDKANNQRDVLLIDPKKLSSTKGSVYGFLPEDSRDQTEVSAGEDGKVSCFRSSLQAPLGISLFSGSISEAWRVLPSSKSAGYAMSYDAGRLLDSETLRERMQQIAALDGLEGVSMDCADILNNGLDVYLKRLIMMSVELVGTRHGCKPSKNNGVKHCSYGKLVNGFRMSACHHNQIQNNSSGLEGTDEKRSYKPISLLDFKVAMELNPQRLGEDWPAVLEKICMHSFEE